MYVNLTFYITKSPAFDHQLRSRNESWPNSGRRVSQRTFSNMFTNILGIDQCGQLENTRKLCLPPVCVFVTFASSCSADWARFSCNVSMGGCCHCRKIDGGVNSYGCSGHGPQINVINFNYCRQSLHAARWMQFGQAQSIITRVRKHYDVCCR